ncbi:MAG: M14 family metallopeptidase [Archangium sp.]
MNSLLLIACLTAAPPLTTISEQSGFTKTGRGDEVEKLCAEFPKRYPGKVKCERFGTTPLGRPMLALITQTSDAKKKPTLMLQGGIHAGEIDGKDAGFWLLRELLDGKVAPGALQKMTLVFVPVFNVDGHDRVSPNQRPNQRGPEEMGWRVTSQNLNLNRDYAKADAPEMIAMLNFMHRIDPILFADLHVTDGAKFQHDVSVTFEPRRLGPESLKAWGRTLKAAIFPKIEAQGHLPVDFYPSFDDGDDPASGFSSGWPPPRFGSAYWAAQHRFGMLVETHSWRPYAHRVKTTFDVCVTLVEETAAHGLEWMAAAKLADDATRSIAGTQVTLLWDSTQKSEPIDFQGYAYTRTKSDVSGKFWVQYDESKPVVWKIPLRDELAPFATVEAPKGGYVIAAPVAALIAPKLAAHGLSFTTMKKPLPQASVQLFRGAPTYRATSYEGRQTVTIKGAWTDGTEDLPAGSLFVPITQPHADFAMHLLEPTLPDSFASWGFFNAYFEQKEYLEDYLTEAFAREQLKDPAVKAAFDEKLKDPAFAKDAEARLAFFAAKHPSADARLGVLPVYRVATPPASN